jgi:3-methyladenine DNA glycosylase AlkD
MQHYMKSTMPFLGVPTPVLRKTCRSLFREHRLPSADAWRTAVLDLWRRGRYREERHAAIELARDPAYEAYRTLAALPIYEEIIVTGAWWDYVDAVATHLLRGLFENDDRFMAREMRAWSRDADMWKRRASIICQVGRKHATDLDLLLDCIEPNLADREFFIRKAIGWGLRSYAWTDIETIERYVERNHQRLSPLSRREALKNRDKLAGSKTT